MPSPRPLPALLRAAPLLLLAACGGGTPPAATGGESADQDGTRVRRPATVADVSAEVGALDPDKVEKAFAKSLPGLQRCLASGAERVEFLGGRVEFFLKIDRSGRAIHAHFESSTLGDRETERCMLGVMQAQAWPPPEGGEVGLARQPFDFDAVNDGRPPESWSADRAAPVVEQLSSAVDQCKAGHVGTFAATVYVGTEGEPLGVGVTPPDEAGDAAVDCLVSALKAARFPSPGGWPAKVTFPL